MRDRLPTDLAPRVLARLDWFNPPAASSAELLRARLVTTFTAVVTFWFLVFCIASIRWMEAHYTAIVIAIFGTTLALSPLVMRYWGVVAGANTASSSVFLAAVGCAYFNGGLDLQVHFSLTIVPVLAASLAGLRSALLWTLAVLVAVLGLFGLDAAGYPFLHDIPAAEVARFHFLLGISIPVALMCFVLLYEHTRNLVTQELRLREEDLAAIIATAQDGLMVIDGAGRILRTNPAAERLFCSDATQLMETSTARLFEGGLSDRTALTGVLAHRTDGTSFPTDITIGRLAVGAVERFVVIVRDVTARHEAERTIAEARDRAVQASRAKSSFLANMSHELRTPLNAILGYAELIAEETLDGDSANAPADAARIIASGRHLLALINDVLDLSKIEAGKLVLEPQPVDVDSLLDAVASSVAPLLANRGNRLVRDVEYPLGTVVTDPLRLRQVLLNLLSNATKFTERGQITLRARRSAEPGRDQLLFEIADTGIGMDPDLLERVFEDFVQADASTTRRYGGTGLGLAISRRIVHMMGGQITVWSEPGVGSTFTLHLPAAPGAAATPVPLGVRGGVLVVDEDPWTRGALIRALRRAGMVVSMAASTEEGLEMAVRLQPRVMVVDVLRSRQGGLDLLERLRSDPSTASIPVAVLALTADRGLALALGAKRLLEERDEVVDAVRELLPVSAGHALVVEDDDDLREILTRTLTRSGWSVAEARDGAQGLAQLAIRDPDVIVLDLMMPSMDGFEFVTRLQSHPTCRDVPVLVVTARDLDAAELDRLRGTVDRVILKGGQTRDDLLNEVLGVVRRQPRPAVAG